MRQLFHFDDVLGDFAARIERKTGGCFVDRENIEVDLRSESSIQCNLALAKVVAFFQRAEIEKTEIYRLLHFEDERRRNEDP